MKTKFLIALSVFYLFFASFAFGDCGYKNGYYSDCQEGSCEFDNKCQCTDPACWRGYDRDCSSMTTCCAAFGNIGAR